MEVVEEVGKMEVTTERKLESSGGWRQRWRYCAKVEVKCSADPKIGI